MQIINNEIADIRFYVSPSGDVFPDEEIDANERTLKGFIWREKSAPNRSWTCLVKQISNFNSQKLMEFKFPEAFFDNSIIKN